MVPLEPEALREEEEEDDAILYRGVGGSASSSTSPRPRFRVDADDDLSGRAFSGCGQTQTNLHAEKSEDMPAYLRRNISLRRVPSRKSFVRDSCLIPPLRMYARRVNQCPWCFTIVYSLCVFILIVAAWRPLEIENSFSAFVRADGEAMRNKEALLLAQKERKGLEAGRRLEEVRAPFYVRKDLTLVYVAKKGNVLEERVLREIRDLEVRLRALPDWQPMCNDLVSMDQTKWLCNPGESITAFAWPTQVRNASIPHQRFHMQFDGQGNELVPWPAVLSYMQHAFVVDGMPSRDLQRFFPKDYIGAPDEAPPASVRSTFSFFLTFAWSGDPPAAQRAQRLEVEERYEKFVADELFPLLSVAASEFQYSDMYYMGDDIIGYEVDYTLMRDILWAIGSIVFVTLYMWFYIRSIVVAIGCFCIIFASVPIAYVLTPTSKTTIASFLSLFLVTVIDIDVVFVFVDFWEQGVFIHKTDKRVAWMIVHAGKSCLATSLTTSMGFFSNLASALQPLREFGMFMGLSVMAVYVLALLFLPPLILIKERSKAQTEKPGVPTENAFAIVPAPPSPSWQQDDDCSPASKHSSSEPPSMAVASKLLSESDETGDRRIYFALFQLVECISSCRIAIVSIAALCFPGFILGTYANLELDMGVPDIFTADHNQVAGVEAASKFGKADSLHLEFAPATKGAACDAAAWPDEAAANLGREVGGECIYNWCGSVSGYAKPRSSTFGECFRGPVRRDGAVRAPQAWTTTGCETLSVTTRLSSPTTPDTNALWPIMAQIMSNLTWGSQDSITTPVQLPPFVSESWETGTVTTSLFFETVATKAYPYSGARCEIQTLCFFGVQPCELGSTWRSAGQYDLNATGAVQRRLTPTSRLDISVVWGLRAPKSTPLVGAPDWMWAYDPTFEPENPWAQRAMYKACTEFDEDLYVMEVECWIQHFREWLIDVGREFPSRNFTADVVEWYQTGTTETKHLWMRDGKVVACKIVFYVNVASDSKPDTALEYKSRWNRWIDGRNLGASVTANRAWHSTQLWVTAEAQDAIISSTIETIVIECCCGWFGIMVFTGDPLLALLVLGLVLTNIGGLAFFMVGIMGWALGPIEIIFLVVFLGYSVTFGLHMAHNYSEATQDDPQLVEGERVARCRMQKRAKDRAGQMDSLDEEKSKVDEESLKLKPLSFTPAQLRKARTRLAVLHVGGAILSSTVSTIGSSLFLLLCTMTLFVKLGLIVISVTCLSIVFTLVALPAVLMLFGPPPTPCHRRLFRFVLSSSQSAWRKFRARVRRKQEGKLDAPATDCSKEPFVAGEVIHE